VALEFKEAAEALPKGFFESACALLNHDGGQIVLQAIGDVVTDLTYHQMHRLNILRL